MSWSRGHFIQIKAGWDQGGRQGVCLGSDLEVHRTLVKWTPVLWDGEEDPDWFKTRGLEPTPGKNRCRPKSKFL